MGAPDTETPPVEEPATPPAAEAETPEPQEEQVTMSKAEADALRRRVAESEKATRRLEDKQKKDDEARKAEEGQHRELAEQRAKELADERAERARVEGEARITRIAGRLKFLDPADVIGRVSAEDAADDTAAETALERIAEQSPHLIAKETTAKPEIGKVLDAEAEPQTPKPPTGKQPLRTMADVEALTQAEYDAPRDEVQAFLSSQ